VARVIVREPENQRRQSIGEDPILVPVAIQQTDIEAVNIAIDDTVCASVIVTFLPCDAMLNAVYAIVVCLCVYVCLSHSGIVSKRLKAGSCK